MKKLLIAGVLLLLIISGGYLFIRFRYLKAKDFKPDTSKERSAIDLRPAIIAKLQQLVKDGSNGLYVLSVEKIEPHLLTSKLDVFNASVHIDTAAMLHMDSLHLLPDDIFTLHFSTLHIDGIGINDLFQKDRIQVTNIHIIDPVVDIYHKKRPYNNNERKNDTLTLYEKLKEQIKKIEVGQINIVNGTFINHDVIKTRSQKFSDVSIQVNDLLIDSATQYDNTRFLFAKHIALNTKNYSVPTPDGLYFFNAGNVSITAEDHSITALNVELKPRYNRQQFISKLPFRKDMFSFKFHKIILNEVNWMDVLQNKNLSAGKAEIANGIFTDFIDRAIPQRPIIIDNFPSQMIMKLPFKVSIHRVDVSNVDVTYEEHNPLSDQNGTVYFDNVNGRISNISNVPAEIKAHPIADFSGKALFMHHVPMTIKFGFDLSKYRTGEFSVDITMDTLDKATINKISEPIGLFSIKSGVMQHAKGHIAGNNFKTTGNITMLYNNLHIAPLKKGGGQGQLQKKTVTGLVANILFIKNDNPMGNELRQPEFTFERDSVTTFFNLIWKTILTGILKTIGIPVKFVIK